MCKTSFLRLKHSQPLIRNIIISILKLEKVLKLSEIISSSDKCDDHATSIIAMSNGPVICCGIYPKFSPCTRLIKRKSQLFNLCLPTAMMHIWSSHLLVTLLVLFQKDQIFRFNWYRFTEPSCERGWIENDDCVNFRNFQRWVGVNLYPLAEFF